MPRLQRRRGAGPGSRPVRRAGSATALVSERDQNFRLTDADGLAWVLKISNAVEDPAVVDMEVEAVRHVARMDPALPRRRPAAGRERRGRGPGPGPSRRRSHGPAHPVPARSPRRAQPDPRALTEIGRVTAGCGALRGFFHPAAGRVILWDLKHLDALRPHLDAVTDPARRAMVDAALERYDRFVAPALPTLRSQVIHNDLTLDNLLLDGDRVTGILDFGDMAHTALVLDLPAMLQSVLRGRTDLFEAAAEAIGGYVAVTPLEPEEADLLADLLAARMVQTVLISVWRTREYPDNAYITGWLEPAYELLEQLEAAGWEEASRGWRNAARGRSRTRHSESGAGAAPAGGARVRAVAAHVRAAAPPGPRRGGLALRRRGRTGISTPTTTSRSWATPIRPWSRPSPARPAGSTPTPGTCTRRSSSRSGSWPACRPAWTRSCS